MRACILLRVKVVAVLASVAFGCVMQDLESRMRASLQDGHAAVIARNGQIIAELDGRGIQPLMAALDADPRAFEGVWAMDKVIGRAAAAIYVVGRASVVSAPIMSEGARDLLVKYGVVARCDKLVPFIVNRKGDGMCPMDRATRDLERPEEIVRVLKEKLRSLPSD